MSFKTKYKYFTVNFQFPMQTEGATTTKILNNRYSKSSDLDFEYNKPIYSESCQAPTRCIALH